MGLEEFYAPGQRNYSRETALFKNNPLTHDRNNFEIEHIEIEKNPELALGGVTWGWLKAAFDSISMLVSEKNISRNFPSIQIPIWIASAAEDTVVCNTTQKRVCNAFPRGTFISIPGACHETLFETDDIQKIFWKAMPLV